MDLPFIFILWIHKAETSDLKVNGWRTCDVMSFQQFPYQDDRNVTMKGCVQWNPVYDRNDSASGNQIRNR